MNASFCDPASEVDIYQKPMEEQLELEIFSINEIYLHFKYISRLAWKVDTVSTFRYFNYYLKWSSCISYLYFPQLFRVKLQLKLNMILRDSFLPWDSLCEGMAADFSDLGQRMELGNCRKHFNFCDPCKVYALQHLGLC